MLRCVPAEYAHLGTLVSIDGSLIDSVLSMEWADYRTGSKKAKAHVGFDLNRGIPLKIYLIAGKEGERPFVDKIIEKGETAVTDPGYQKHSLFDICLLQGITADLDRSQQARSPWHT